jgi:transcriptional regulator with XRE-family HTH domain
MNAFKDTFKKLRNKKGLTQEELTKELSVYLGTKISRSTIGSYEQGARQPDIETLISIANYFKVDMNYLLGWVDESDNWLGTDSTAEEEFGLGKRLYDLRKGKNLSIEELALKSGISARTIGNLEANTYKQLNFSTISKLAKVLNTEAWDIAGFTDIYWDMPISNNTQPTLEHLSEIEEAYSQAPLKLKNIVRLVLDLEPIA